MTSVQSSRNLPNKASKFNAHNLTCSDKITLSLKVLSKNCDVGILAKQYGVSRNYLYDLAKKAESALNESFGDKPDTQDDDDAVLYHFPVTKEAIKKIVIALSLVCHSSIRNTEEFLSLIFDYSISVGTIFNILQEKIDIAKLLNKQVNLEQIKVTAHDEIYHNGKPVLVAACVHSEYIALLKQEQSCDSTTWGCHLIDLKQKKKVNVEYSIADGGKGLRAGQKEAWTDVPCHADIFHAIRDLNDLAYRLDKRAYGKITEFYSLQERLRKPKNQNDVKLQTALVVAKTVMDHAIRLADDVKILAQWMREDVLGKVGYTYEERYMLYNFIVAELANREPMKERYIKPVRTKFENQRDDLLAFSELIDTKLKNLSTEFNIPFEPIRKTYESRMFATDDFRRYMLENEGRKHLGKLYNQIELEIEEIIESTVRASSCVENVNSILRPFFFLRKQLGADFLELLQFYLNHRRYSRSEHPERVGKSPTELLTGKPHKSWLEILGFKLFKRPGNDNAKSSESEAYA